MAVMGTVRGLTTNPQGKAVLPPDAKADLSADIGNTGSAVRVALDAAGLGKGAQSNAAPTGVGARAGVFDSSRHLYTPVGASLHGIRSALAPALTGAGLARAAWIGHSIVAGYGATPGTTTAPILAASALASKYGVAVGSGLVNTNNNVPGDPDDARYTYDPAQWTTAGGPRINNAQLHRGSSALGATLTFASTRAGTVVDIYTFTNSRPFTYSIDGAEPVAVTPSGTGSVQKFTATGLANTTHTVVITVAGTTGATYILGVDVRPTTGLELAGLGYYGASVADWAPTNNNSIWFNPFHALLATSPDLVLIQLGANELIHNIGAATLKTNLGALTAGLTNRGKHVVLIVDPPMENTGVTNWATEFRSAIYDVADTYAVPLVDITNAWGSRAQSSGNYFDQWHPNATGYQSIANIVTGALFR